MARLKIGIAIGAALSTALLCAVLWNFGANTDQVRQEREEKLSESGEQHMQFYDRLKGKLHSFFSDSENTAQESLIDNKDVTKADKQYMQFNDWLDGKFRSKSFYPNWVSDSEYATRNGDNEIVKKDIITGVETILLGSTAWGGLESPSGFSVSKDLKYVAITYKSMGGYAHYMTTFSVAVYDTTDSSAVSIPGFPTEGIQKIKWDSTGHKMAYVHAFDIYVVTNFTVEPFRVTDDGEENEKFNGITDWLYAVEITNDDALLWWSPDSTYLAYATIDQNDVKKFDFALFEGNIYPNMISFPYPKPGTPIPTTQTFVINSEDMASGSKEAVPSDDVLAWGEFYLNSAIWRNNSVFSPTWKSRFENESISESCVNGSVNFDCSHVSSMEIRSETGWVGHYKPADLVAMPLGNEYMTVLSNPDGFPHLAVVDADADNIDWRTSGTFEVTDTGVGDQSIYYYDSVNDWVYFTSTEYGEDEDGLPRIRHMWRVKAHGDNKTRECITCGLNEVYPNRCNWVRPSFSPGGSNVVVNCGGTGNGAPISTRHTITSDGMIGGPEVVENNDDLLANLDAYYFRDREYGTIELPGVDGEFYYTLHKPPNFDTSKKYPMLVQVYSGPGFQEVEDRFAVSWKDFVASSLDVIVMSFDGRGTGFRGDKILHEVYLNLGQYEPADQIAAAKKLGEDNDFIDTTKTAIWGWSYGGYATTRTIGDDSEGVFKCGYAVAPVTDWLSYHTIYTERYMKTPAENQNGYDKSTTMQKFDNFKSHQYFLFHGTADENVHFQNSARLSKALIENDVDFGAYFAGDDDHSMGRQLNHYRNVYKMITRQMCRCFDLDKPDVGVLCGKTSEENRKLRRKKK